MLHNEIKKLAESIGNELQEAAEDANRVAAIVSEPEKYLDVQDWRDEIDLEVDELVADLDLLVVRCGEVRDALDKAKRGVPA